MSEKQGPYPTEPAPPSYSETGGHQQPYVFQQPPPGAYQQPPPGAYQQPPQGAYQQPPPGAYQQPPPGAYPPGAYQQPPPGTYQPGPHDKQGMQMGQPMGQQGVVVTGQPGYGQQVVITQLVNPPPDYLIQSILSCFCCWPIAIFALIYSVKSRDAAKMGNHPEALSRGQVAKKCCIAALVCGLIIIALNIVRVVVQLTVLNNNY